MSLKSKIESNKAVVGVIGLGYVGLPLLRGVPPGGLPRHRVRRRPGARSTPCSRARTTSSTSARSWSTGHARSGRFDATADFAPARRGRRDHQLRADAARQAPRAGPVLRREDRRRHRQDAAPGPARRAGIDDLPAHDARDHAAALRGAGPEVRRRFLPRLLPRARRPRPQGLQHADASPSSSAASTPPVGEVAAALYRKAIKQVIPVSQRRGRRGGQAAGEHLPRRQHRAGERDEDGARRRWASTSGR